MSFGSSGFGGGGFGSNSNNNNNNNNQQSGGLFGSGSGFGSNTTSGFGSSTNTGFGSNNNTTSNSLFGGNNQSNTGFGSNTGGFGASNSNSASPFGGNTNSNNNQPSFGSGNNASGGGGGGLFGSSTNTAGGFGSGGGFGSNTNTGFGSGNAGGGGLFGNASNTNNTTSSGFGATSNTGGGLFGGGGASSSGFGGGSNNAFGGGGFGSNPGATGQNPGTGQITQFTPFSEKDTGNTTSNYYSVGFQQPQQPWSFEELRMQDYDQGRKYGNQNGQGGAFGTSSGFGGTSTTNNAFGGSSGFGQSGFGSNQNNTSAFGSQQNSGFGSNPSGGFFGQPNNKPSLFGTPATTSTSTGGGLFSTASSNNNNTSGGSLFGSSNTGGFGAPNKTGFGSSTSGGFGNASSGNTLFGGGSGSGFSTQNQQNSTPAQNSGFGTFGASSTNSNNATGKSLFGGQTGGSLFGGTAQSQQQNTNPFGQPANQANNTGASLFNSKPSGSNLFSTQPNNQANSGSNLFGNPTGQNQQQNSGSLFGPPKPSGLFPNNNTSTGFGGSSFGGSLTQDTNQTGAGNSLFGNPNQSQPQLGGSLFGSSQQQQQVQQPQQPQQLSASMMNAYPYGHEQLFADLGTPEKPVGPIATPLSSSQKARRPAPLPAWKINPSASMRLITPQKRPNAGYGFSYSAYGTPSSTYSTPSYSSGLASVGAGGNRILSKSISVGNMRNSDDSGLFRPDAFSPSLRPTSGRGSMKRLHIDRSLRTSFLADELDNSNKTPLRKTVSFDSEATPNANGETSTALVRRQESDLGQGEENGFLRTIGQDTAPNGPLAAPEMEQLNGNTPERPVHLNSAIGDTPPTSRDFVRAAKEARANREDMPPGDYWCKPSMGELKEMSRDELASIKDFTVGRHGMGKIVFGEVNLQRVNLESILGHIVDIGLRSATVYPDHATKPPEGRDLNVPSIVYLENSWPRAQRGRTKIPDPSGPQIQRHLQRLKSVEGTTFEDYNPETGTWKFSVHHFSTYQFEYEDESALDSSMLSAPPGSLGPSPQPMISLEHPVTDPQHDSSILSNDSNNHHSHVDDTFAFRKSHTSMPGAFDNLDVEFTPDFKNTSIMQSVGDVRTRTPGSGRSSPPMSEVPHGSFLDSPLAGRFPPTLDGTTDARPTKHSPSYAAAIRPRSILKNTQQSQQIVESPSKNLVDIDDETWAEQLQRTLSPRKQDRQLLRESQGLLLQNRQPGTVSLPKAKGKEKPFVTSFDIMNSLFGQTATEASQRGKKQSADGKDLKWPYPKRPRLSERVENMSNADQAFHESNNPTWTTDGALLMPISRSGEAPKRVAKSRQAGVLPMQAFAKPTNTHAFTQYQSLVDVSLDSSNIPFASPPSSLSFADFANCITSTPDTTSASDKEVWELLQILFDPQDPTEGNDVTAATRKSLFSQYWKSVVTPSALSHAQRAANSEEKAFALLSAHDIWGATEALLSGGNPKLATIVSQLDAADSTFKASSRQQIDQWRDNNVLSEIPYRIRSLYELLAGNTCTARGTIGAGPESNVESFSISSQSGLDWRRSFGLRLWYATLRNEPIEAAIRVYNTELSSYEEQIRPLPKFIEDKVETGWSDPEPDTRTDVLWSFLKLYATRQSGEQEMDDKDIATLLAPENVAGHPLEARLSFLLCQTLQARGLLERRNQHQGPNARDEEEQYSTKSTTYLSDNITSVLLSQLSGSASSLASAVLVALHFAQPATRATAVQALLTRHAAALGASPETCPTWQELSAMKIPPSWVWEAKANYARSVLGNENARCVSSLRAGNVIEACEVLRSVVAPGAVVAEHLLATKTDIQGLPSNLKMLLEEFQCNEEATTLTEWRNGLGGAAYVRYVKLVEKVEKHKKSGRTHWTSNESREVAKLVADVKRGLPSVRSTEELGLHERVAAWEIGRVLDEVEEGLRREEDGMVVEVEEDGDAADGGVMRQVEKAEERYRKKAMFA